MSTYRLAYNPAHKTHVKDKRPWAVMTPTGQILLAVRVEINTPGEAGALANVPGFPPFSVEFPNAVHRWEGDETLILEPDHGKVDRA